MADGWVEIRREGVWAKLNHNLAGNTRIPVANVTAVELKRPTLGRGYIKFSVLGGQDRGLRWNSALGTDEHRVLFGSKALDDFVRVKDVVESQIGRGAFYSAPTTPALIVDVADQIQKLAALRDQGVLTEEEFQAQKAKMLGG